ncbi:Transcription factor spt8 [Dispira simplex]|nr:Transcription factor spt8 [Dispira simplex]
MTQTTDTSDLTAKSPLLEASVLTSTTPTATATPSITTTTSTTAVTAGPIGGEVAQGDSAKSTRPGTLTIGKSLVKPKVALEQVQGEGEVTILERPVKPPRPYYKTAGVCRTYDVTPYVLAVHPNPIYSVASTPCMTWVLTGSEDGYIRRWNFFDSMNGTLALTQNQRHMQVDTVTKAGVMTSYWDNDDNPEPYPDIIRGSVKNPYFSRNLSPVYSLNLQSEALWAVSGQEKDVALWTVRHDEGRKYHVFQEHTAPVSALQISPDEYGMVSGSWDKRILYWDLNSGKIAREFKGHVSQISSVHFRPFYRLRDPPVTAAGDECSPPSPQPVLLTSSIDGQCKLWDLRDPTVIPRPMNPLDKTPPWCTATCWARDGGKVYIGRRNGSIDEWDFASGKLIRSLRLPNNSGLVSSVACTVNNKQLLCGSLDNLRMWDLAHAEAEKGLVPFQILPGHHGVVISSILLDDSGRFMITAAGNRGWEGPNANSCYFYEMKPHNERPPKIG